ncbi:hypothetical protein WJX72_003245 [[Myrmecia] bisecta]|uniref:Glycosyl hydrolase family 13 catalytic domain-containing protein n=1 Tax=[Myrmecia] bisecta TaxID=41462 RepID=A0AAW1QQ04_9CHLO
MLRPCWDASRATRTALRFLCLLLLTAVPALASVKDWYDPVRGQDYWKSVWRQRSIYAIQADRWDTTEPAENECTTLRDLTKYCGGNFKGIERRTDYLKGMNVDAFMMSSVTDNTPGGYHGYWPCDFYSPNTNYGTKSDLKHMVHTMESAGVHVMMDVVTNHVGYGDYSYCNPFNQPEHFHNCTGCGHYIYWDCSIPPDFTRKQNLECRLAGLPDLNQNNPFVRDKLKEWVQWLRGEYGFTGLRIDALANIDPAFAQEFTRSSGLFALGELPTAAASIAEVLQPVKAYYDLPNGLGLLDFFTVDPIRNVFCGEWRCFTGFGTPWNSLGTTVCAKEDRMDPFKDLEIRSTKRLARTYQAFVDAKLDQSLLGRFIDNHDFKRFLAANPNVTALRNALTYLYFNEGIPILYYGTEQELTGVGENLKDYESRQPMWLWGFNRAKPTYVFVRMLNWYRWKMGLWDLSLKEVYLDDNHYGFRRGTSFLVVITNGQGPLQPSLNFYNLEPGVKLCNVLRQSQCITGDANGNATTSYSPGGEPMIFVLPSVYHPLQYFVPADAIPVAWQKALTASVITITVSFAVGLLVPYLVVMFLNRKTPPPEAIVVSSRPDPAAGGAPPVNRPSSTLQRWRLHRILRSVVAKKRALVTSAAASVDANNAIAEARDSEYP